MRNHVLISISLATLSVWSAGCARGVSAAEKEAQAKESEAAAIREAEAKKPKFLSIPAGTPLTVRLNQSLSTATNRRGEHFSATLSEPVMVNGQMMIPVGVEVNGIIEQSFPSGRLKGRAGITLALQEIELAGGDVAIDTTTRSSVSGRHRRRNWAWIGGGAATGASIGAMAGGGPGAAIGAGSGATAGLVTAVFTGKKQVSLPAETRLTFKLSRGIEVPAL